MKETATIEQMSKLDQLSVELGHNLMQMTELAGYNLASFVSHRYPSRTHKNIMVFCGGGNNGSAGLCAAKHLINNDHNVIVFLNTKRFQHKKLSDISNHHLNILDKLNTNIVEDIADIKTDIIVDCLIGTGLKDSLRKKEEDLITKINDSTAISVSLDVPSGLNADSGSPSPIAVQAEHTTMLAARKPGLIDNEYAGILHIYDIGIPKVLYEKLGLFYPF